MARDSMVVNFPDGTVGGYEKRIALIEPQRASNHPDVVRLAVGGGADSEIGAGDSVDLAVFP